MRSNIPALDLANVSFGYTNNPVLQDISLTVRAGEMVAVLGPNASGKTTLLRLIAGTLQPQEGHVLLEGVDITQIRRRQVANRMAVVPQAFNMPFAFTANEVVMVGRTPHIRPLMGPRQVDIDAVEMSLNQLGIADLGHRFFNDLSGGEQQTVILAMALAQAPRILLLDEPTAHLDINHQVEILDMVKKFNQDGMTVVAAIHDLNLAALYFPRLVFFHQGRVFADGHPHNVLTQENIQEVYSTTVAIHPHPTMEVPQMTILPSWQC